MSISALRVVRPIVVTPAMLVSTNVDESDYPAWAGASTYAVGDRVIVLAAHSVYQSAIAGNSGKDPQTNPDAWKRVGPTNRWKAFDSSNSTQTKRAGSISYRLTPGQPVTAFAALNIVGATSIRVQVIDPVHGVMYDKTTAMSGRLLNATWWNWHFGDRDVPRQFIQFGLPIAPNADVLIDISGTADLAVGVLLIGQARSFSMGVNMGARVGIRDFSRKEQNEWGDTFLMVRDFARRANFSMLLKASEVDLLYRFLSDVRATPCLWVGSDRYEATTVYGPYEDFDIVLSYHDYSDCELELKGLT
jgi:hypothetical protein